MSELTTQDWYKILLEDLKKLAFKGISIIKWQIGDRILADFDKFGNPKYGDKRVEGLAKDLDVSSQDIWFCLAYRRKFSNALENVSWREIIKQLPEPKKEKGKTPELPKGKYQVIYADPPWDIGSMVLDKWESPLADKYPTMTREELLELPIQNLTADDCVCFMWATLSTLPQALELLNTWGFQYHITITWDKGNGWSMSGFHRKTELCLVGYKGILSNVVKQKGEYIPTVFAEKKRKHSEKPELMYKFIEERTIGSKVELFARIKRKGWTFWGDQLNGND